MSAAALLGKLRRLPEMDGREIRHRLGESLHRGVERASHLLGRPDGEEGFLARLPGGSATAYLREVAAARFYLPADAAGRAALAALVARRVPAHVPALAAEAERLLAHRVELLGFGEVDLGREIDWHRDPLTGRSWERRFWGDYDLVRDHPAGDPKVIHELARHQHLPRLGKAYLLLGDERYAREVVAQMLGWIEQDPPGEGVHWHSSLEIALRAVSWLWALFFVLPSEALSEAAARRIGASLFAQLDHVHRYPSVFSSPNTHLLGEATALFLSGLVFQGCGGAAAWRERGAELLAAEADRQVLADGVHAELATGYHAYALDFYLQALALAERIGYPLPARVAERTAAMADFLLHVMHPDGTLPLLGDDDGGRALALERTSYRRPGDLLATAAALFGRGDFAFGAGALPEETLWLLGPGAERRFEALDAAPPGQCHRAFPAAGYVVQRTGWRRGDAHLVFDGGGLGELGGGHGHADALALTLFAGGRELIADPGTYVYNGAPEWRDAFRSTRAHSTVTVDGRDQSRPGDTFRWRSRASARLLEDDSGLGGLDFAAAEHHGYAEAPDGVVHRRRLLHVRPDYWLVIDDFRAADAASESREAGAEHRFEVVYQLAPGVEVDDPVPAGPRAARVEALAAPAALGLFVHASAPLEVEVVRGGGASGTGWVSARYGEKRPAPAVVARFRSPLPAAAVSVLAPRDGRPGRRVRPWCGRALDLAAAAPALAVEIVRGGRHARGARSSSSGGGLDRDLAIVSPGAPPLDVELGPGDRVSLQGELVWARLGPGREVPPRRLFALRAGRFSRGGRAVFVSPDAITHYESAFRGSAELPDAGLETTPCAESQAS